MTWRTVVGLEFHVQLRTASKMFCGCPNAYGRPPNTDVCPVCAGLPGALPVVNAEAVAQAARLGLAVGATVHPVSVFARKNYFYPDLPKGYQISQYDRPLCTGGALPIEVDGEARSIRLERIHLEEDAGTSTHDESTSRVDLDRAGVPLCEVVTRPDLRSAAEATTFMRAMRSAIRYLGVSDGNMEEGSLRCDANVSVHQDGEPLGTKVEVKNLNSFRFVAQAIEHEAERQRALLEAGTPVAPETRRFDTRTGRTVFMRGKEEAQDYRYFPEPDLPPLRLEPGFIEDLRQDLPPLAWERAARYRREWGLPAYDAGELTVDRSLADWFEGGADAADDPRTVKLLANWTMGEVRRLLNEDGLSPSEIPLPADALLELIALVEAGSVGGGRAKEALALAWRSGDRPAAVVEAQGWRQMQDTDALREAVEGALAAHPAEVARYRAGAKQLRGFFVGRVMKATAGRADAKKVAALVGALLDD